MKSAQTFLAQLEPRTSHQSQSAYRKLCTTICKSSKRTADTKCHRLHFDKPQMPSRGDISTHPLGAVATQSESGQISAREKAPSEIRIPDGSSTQTTTSPDDPSPTLGSHCSILICFVLNHLHCESTHKLSTGRLSIPHSHVADRYCCCPTHHNHQHCDRRMFHVHRCMLDNIHFAIHPTDCRQCDAGSGPFSAL